MKEKAEGLDWRWIKISLKLFEPPYSRIIDDLNSVVTSECDRSKADLGGNVNAYIAGLAAELNGLFL